MITTLALKIATTVFSVRICCRENTQDHPSSIYDKRWAWFFSMSFKYVFKSIKFPRQNFLFFKFGRVLVRNSGSLPTVPTWGYFPGELPILQLSSWKKQRGLVPLLPYELFLHSTGISLFPYTHIAEAGYLSLIFGSFIWTLPLLASLCSGWFLFYQRHFLSDMFMGPYLSLAVVEADSHGEIWPSYSSRSVTKRTFF